MKHHLKSVKLGIDKLLKEPSKYFDTSRRVGLVCNQATVDHGFRHAADLFYEHPEINLTTLFGPQHGIRGDVQDNMIETGHAVDKHTGLPVYSLYSETREPTDAMLENVDVLVFDLQDIGCRVYTFMYTMAYSMKACARLGKKCVVLDRPNPINGLDIEGSILEKGHESFVGLYPIPMRHGLTMGELANLFNQEFGIGCDLTVVTVDGWTRELYYDETDAPWVMPSPNMPTIDTAVVFPGTVWFEGTRLSEGRGTTKPFETIGAPFIDSKDFTAAMNEMRLPGVTFRAVDFIPTFQKCADQNCGGTFLHVTDRGLFEPVYTALTMVKKLIEMYGAEFKWKEPPYEYVYDRNPFDVISGSVRVREICEGAGSYDDLRAICREGNEEFSFLKIKYHLY